MDKKKKAALAEESRRHRVDPEAFIVAMEMMKRQMQAEKFWKEAQQKLKEAQEEEKS